MFPTELEEALSPLVSSTVVKGAHYVTIFKRVFSYLTVEIAHNNDFFWLFISYFI